MYFLKEIICLIADLNLRIWYSGRYLAAKDGEVNRRTEKIAISFRKMRLVHVRRFGEMKITFKIFV